MGENPARVRISIGSALNFSRSTPSASQNVSSSSSSQSRAATSTSSLSEFELNRKLSDLCSTKSTSRRKRKSKTDLSNETGGNLTSKKQATPSRPTSNNASSRRQQGTSGPRVVFKDGKMVIEESSLEMAEDGHFDGDEFPYEEITEENQATATYSSFKTRAKVLRWGLEETWLFYQALRQCGLEFSLMQSFFPGRTRVSLKRKFYKEEKEHPELIKQTLYTSLPLDMTVYTSQFVDENNRLEADDGNDEEDEKADANALNINASLNTPDNDQPQPAEANSNPNLYYV